MFRYPKPDNIKPDQAGLLQLHGIMCLIIMDIDIAIAIGCCLCMYIGRVICMLYMYCCHMLSLVI